MSYMSLPQRANGHPILRHGFIFGALLGALGLGNALIQWLAGADVIAVHVTAGGFASVTVNDTGATSLLGCVVFLATLALTGVAGVLAARRMGKVGTGALAGLLAGAIGGLIGNGSGLLILLALVAPGVQTPAGSDVTQAQIQALAIGTSVVGAVLGMLVSAGFGAGLGALGGLVGASRARQQVPVGAAPGYPGVAGQAGTAWGSGPYAYPPTPTLPAPPPSDPPQTWPVS